MSNTAPKLDAILGRAVRDANFREALLNDPAAAARDYNLSADELAELRSVDKDTARSFFQGASAEVVGLRMKDWCTDKTCYERG